MPLLEPWSFNGQFSVGCFLRGDESPHSTGLSFHPSHGCLSGRSCLCALLLLTGSRSVISVLYLFLRVVAGYEEPLLLFPPPEMDFLGHISDLKLFVGGRVGPAGYLALLPRRHAFPGTFL